ncbi:hypothetical protein Ancab_017739, partial [Ancistrocladus abbreviatus]
NSEGILLTEEHMRCPHKHKTCKQSRQTKPAKQTDKTGEEQTTAKKQTAKVTSPPYSKTKMEARKNTHSYEGLPHEKKVLCSYNAQSAEKPTKASKKKTTTQKTKTNKTQGAQSPLQQGLSCPVRTLEAEQKMPNT